MPASGTIRQKAAIKHLVENKGSIAEAMRVGGYKKGSIKNPSILTKSQAFSKVLDKMGLTDSRLAILHTQLAEANQIEKIVFPHTLQYFKHKKRRRARAVPLPRAEIEEAINQITGAKLLSVSHTLHESIAMVIMPDQVTRKSGVEMAYKTKGHFAPEAQTVRHEMTDEEREIYRNLFKGKK